MNRFDKFSDADALFSNGAERVHLLGALWLHKEPGNTYGLWCQGDLICCVDSGSIVRFTASLSVITKHIRTLADKLHLVMPILILPTGKDEFRLDMTPRSLYDIHNNSPKYAPGISFDLTTGHKVEGHRRGN